MIEPKSGALEIFTQIWDEKGEPNKLDWSLDFLDLIIPLQIIDENDKNDNWQRCIKPTPRSEEQTVRKKTARRLLRPRVCARSR